MRIKEAWQKAAWKLLTPPTVRQQIKAERERALQKNTPDTPQDIEPELGLMVFADQANQEEFAEADEEIIEGEITESNAIYSPNFFDIIAPTKEFVPGGDNRLCVWMLKDMMGAPRTHTKFSKEVLASAAYQLYLALNVDYLQLRPFDLIAHIDNHLRLSGIDSIAISHNGATREIKIQHVLRDLNRLHDPLYYSRTKHEITHQQVLQILEQHFGPRS